MNDSAGLPLPTLLHSLTRPRGEFEVYKNMLPLAPSSTFHQSNKIKTSTQAKQTSKPFQPRPQTIPPNTPHPTTNITPAQFTRGPATPTTMHNLPNLRSAPPSREKPTRRPSVDSTSTMQTDTNSIAEKKEAQASWKEVSSESKAKKSKLARIADKIKSIEPPEPVLPEGPRGQRHGHNFR